MLLLARCVATKVLSRISSCMCAGFVNKHRKLRVNHGEIYAAATGSGPFLTKTTSSTLTTLDCPDIPQLQGCSAAPESVPCHCQIYWKSHVATSHNVLSRESSPLSCISMPTYIVVQSVCSVENSIYGTNLIDPIT